MSRKTAWFPYEEKYSSRLEDDYENRYERCDVCDERVSAYDGRHGIEACMRSLADRVKLLWEQNQAQTKEIANLRKELRHEDN